MSAPLTSHGSIATATLRLLCASRDAGVERFVHSSSSSVYGDSLVSPKHEELPTRAISPYGVAKLAAEGYVRVFAALHGLRTVSLRYFNVFGPGQDPASQYAAVIPCFITRALADEPLIVNGDGEQTRDFTYVDNVVHANLRAAAADGLAGRAYNIAAGQPHSVNELVQELARLLGRRLEIEHGPERADDIRFSHGDISAARRDLAWSPRVSFAEGLGRTVEWFRR